MFNNIAMLVLTVGFTIPAAAQSNASALAAIDQRIAALDAALMDRFIAAPVSTACAAVLIGTAAVEAVGRAAGSTQGMVSPAARDMLATGSMVCVPICLFSSSAECGTSSRIIAFYLAERSAFERQREQQRN